MQHEFIIRDDAQGHQPGKGLLHKHLVTQDVVTQDNKHLVTRDFVTRDMGVETALPQNALGHQGRLGA